MTITGSCPDCDGFGTFPCTECDEDDPDEHCRTCGGEGAVECATCDGTGVPE